ncbi:hypothetical protein KPLM21_270214 [Klebsiella pneumoniae]|nr:hypothetical protein KPLM21_270214 [Klebsiella pneumoniae]
MSSEVGEPFSSPKGRTLPISHSLFVGGTRAPESHSELCSWGCSRLPPRCCAKYFVYVSL